MKGLYSKYFVLKPEGTDRYAIASRLAMATYAHSIIFHNGELSDDIMTWLRGLKENADFYEFMHRVTDSLIADFLANNNNKLPSNTNLLELMRWSNDRIDDLKKV